MVGLLLLLASPLAAMQSPADSADFHDRARKAQANFERFHRARLPFGADEWGASCDEQIGRICLRFDNDFSWDPAPETSSVKEAREELLDFLADLGSQIPGDRWIMGQRVRYLGDVGRWREAEDVARGCQGDPAWWCYALLGYVRHRSGRTVQALRDFARALSTMDPEEAELWSNPALLVPYPVASWLRGREGMPRDAAVQRFWDLADPLFLTPGNERLAEHYARRFASTLYARSELTMRLRWGRSLEELLLRYGFVAGWERARPAPGEVGAGSVVEHHHPESRGLLPPFEALEDPSGLPEGVWVPEDDHPKSASAPVSAPLVVTGSGQTAVLRRAGNLLVVAAYGVPDDDLLFLRRGGGWTSSRAKSGTSSAPRPPSWEPSRESQNHDTVAGLFLLPETGSGPPRSAIRSGSHGVLRLPAPPGAYLLSLELWNPSERWGARIRHGVRAPAIPLDVPTVSDLLLLDPADELPSSLEEALRRMRPTTRVNGSTPITVAWEVYGLWGRSESVEFTLSLVRADQSVVRTVLRKIGLLHRGPPLRLSWSETVRPEGSPLLRAVDVTLPAVEEGRYVLRLEMDLPYRSTVLSSRRITVF